MGRATTWFTMEPDMYGGKECDELVPRWRCYAEGDKDSDHQHEPLSLDPRLYPPGTKITIVEPVCPDCGELRGVNFPKPDKPDALPAFDAKCDCGFDWEEWTANEFS